MCNQTGTAHACTHAAAAAAAAAAVAAAAAAAGGAAAAAAEDAAGSNTTMLRSAVHTVAADDLARHVPYISHCAGSHCL
jgi:hypothetical protein